MKWAAAAAAAASAAATAVASAAAAGSERRVSPCGPNPTGSPQAWTEEWRTTRAAGAAEDRFAPRFDGLRFIETLVTAHR